MSLLRADIDRARALAIKLYSAFYISGEGIFGRTDMPENDPPAGVKMGSLEHLMFITLTGTIDYGGRESFELWKIARETYANPKTRYLFDPLSIHNSGFEKVKQDMNEVKISRKPKDPLFWQTVAVTFLKKWDGDPRRFLEDCGYNAPAILSRLSTDSHLMNGRQVSDYPCLQGQKVSRVWIRMLRDNVGITLTGLEDVSIPVDKHILRATLCTGVLKGRYKGSNNRIFKEVHAVWKEAVIGLKIPNTNRTMIALDMDPPLWHLSKFGCSPRRKGEYCECRTNCLASPGCASGQITTRKSDCEVET